MSERTVSIVRPGVRLDVHGDGEPRGVRLLDHQGEPGVLGEPQPHHDDTTSWTPAEAISRICARTTGSLELE
jgi:hypothetical protein